jgi:serine/threonine protein kinase
MGKRLVVISGIDRGRVIKLDDTDIIQFGCSQTLPVETRLRDPEVARVHCEIQVKDDCLHVVDAATPGGTFLNGRRITNQELQPNDIIRIGSTEIRYLADLGSRRVSSHKRSDAKSMRVLADKLNHLAGRKFTHFHVGVLLGSGRWGKVFRAGDTRSERVVALKVLRPEFAEHPEARRHLKTALRSVRTGHHPNLLNHLSAGIAGAFGWVAMEYVEGKSLTQVIRRMSDSGPMSWPSALRMAIKIALGVEAAHRVGLVHGHITPQNILVRDGDKEPLLGDLLFSHTLTRIPDLEGSDLQERKEDLAYLAPEVHYAPPQTGIRSDIFSVGSIAYTLVAGRAPFSGETWKDVLKDVQQNEPPMPSTHQPALPFLFENAILKMLQKRPESRFETATEMVTNLEHVAKCLKMPL